MVAQHSRKQPQVEPNWSHGAGFAPVEGVGETLRRARKDRGENLRKIADNLRVRHAYLQALEDGDHDRLPGTTYALGFLRSYAEHLGLDSFEIVERYKAERQGSKTHADLVFPEPVADGRMPGGAIILISVLLLALVYGGWTYFSSRETSVADLVPELPDRLQGLIATETSPAPAPASGGLPQDDAMTYTPPAAEVEPAPAPPAAATPPSPESAAPAMAPAPAAPEPDLAVEQGPQEVPQEVAEAGPETAFESASETPGDLAAPTAATDAATDIEADVSAPDFQAAAPVLPGQAGREIADATSSASGYSAMEPTQDPAQAPAPGRRSEPAPESLPSASSETASEDSSEASPETAVVEETVVIPAPPTSAPEVAALPGETTPRSYGQSDGPSRIVLRATQDSWVQVRDAQDALLLTRVLRAGDTYRVPDRPGLTLLTGNAGGLAIEVDGVTLPALGPVGAVRRQVELDPERLVETLALPE